VTEPVDTDDEKARLFRRLRGDPWIQTYTGRVFNLIVPDVSMVDIEDIAHALANICRYTGHAKRFFSVAEHCCHVCDLLEREHGPRAGFLGLMHEGEEPYVGDMSSPLKAMCEDYRIIGRHIWERAVAPKFDLPLIMPPEVKRADIEALATEAPQVMRVWPPVKLWNLPVEEGRNNLFTVEFWSPEGAENAFMERFERLRDAA
jgi:hypothetical protein